MKALALTVALTIVLTPVTALAEGMKEVNAEDQDRIEDLGDVKADGEKEDAVEIWADGHKAEVTTGSLESADRNGLFTYAEHNAEINVDVKGDINTPAEISPEKSASGVTTNALWGSSQDINVNGNIISGDDGITVKTSDRYEGDAAEQGDFVLFSIDVNGLKTVNDTKGHAAGDELIKGAADCLALSVGKKGKAYRTGGDEFMAVVHTGDPEGLRNAIKDKAKEWHGVYTDEITMSIGYAAHKDQTGASIDDLEHIVDADMYAEKEKHYKNAV